MASGGEEEHTAEHTEDKAKGRRQFERRKEEAEAAEVRNLPAC
jgi:hypothetical protein